jgi:hypothetical protein
MDTSKILSELRAERDRIHKAIAALEALEGTSARPRTARKSAASASAGQSAPKRGRRPSAGQSAPKRGRRQMSAAGRKRISEMMKKRWAERRKKA